MKSLSIIASLFILLSCQTKTTQKTENKDSISTATISDIDKMEEALTFAFSSITGDSLLAFEENTNPAPYTQTFDNQGNITKINFIKTQKNGEEHSINLTPYNFSSCTGQLFTLSAGKKADSNFTSLLFNEEFSKNHQAISVKTLEKPQVIDSKIKTAIATERRRAIKNAWKIADLGENQSAYIVVFAPKKDSVLASLVISGKQFIYRDYPAKYDEGSTWRVDDGGEFPNDAIKILAIFRNQKGELEVITEWAGAEGANIEYFKFVAGKIEVIKEASRYWGAG
jgi:hypothetical protein